MTTLIIFKCLSKVSKEKNVLVTVNFYWKFVRLKGEKLRGNVL